MTAYHVKTQEDYDALMIELEDKGFKWIDGKKPTHSDEFKRYGKDVYIYDRCGAISLSDGEYFKDWYSDEPIIEYKAKRKNMTEEEMKRNLQKNAFDVYVAVETFAVRGISEAESDLKEAKSSAKKLIEKIDEYLETLKPKFKVGDYVVELDKYITKITEKNDDDMFKVHFFMPGNNHFSCIKDIVSSYTARHATQEEIEEYEAALTFYKNDRKPFYVKEGDLIKSRSGNKKIISFPKDFSKIDFVNGNWEFLKTAEEVNEWLENK